MPSRRRPKIVENMPNSQTPAYKIDVLGADYCWFHQTTHDTTLLTTIPSDPVLTLPNSDVYMSLVKRDASSNAVKYRGS